MKLYFVKANDVKNTKEVLAVWNDVAEERVFSVCANYIEGFIQAVTELTDRYFLYPCIMQLDGYRCNQRHSDVEYRFENEEGKVISERLFHKEH